METDFNSRTIICLAGNRKQFDEWRRSVFRVGSTLVYATNKEKIQGVQADEVAVVGTFWDRGDAGELYELAQSRIY